MDGPSAGVAMAVVTASAMTGRPVDGSAAVTGEVSVRGLVKPVGGVPGIVEAAAHAGLKKVLIPNENRLERFANAAIEVVPITTLKEALDMMLMPETANVILPEITSAVPAPLLAAEEHTAQGRA